MGFIIPSQNQPKYHISLGVINPTGIPIPMGFITQNQTSPKFHFSVGVRSPWEIPTRKGVK